MHLADRSERDRGDHDVGALDRLAGARRGHGVGNARGRPGRVGQFLGSFRVTVEEGQRGARQEVTDDREVAAPLDAGPRMATRKDVPSPTRLGANRRIADSADRGGPGGRDRAAVEDGHRLRPSPGR